MLTRFWNAVTVILLWLHIAEHGTIIVNLKFIRHRERERTVSCHVLVSGTFFLSWTNLVCFIVKDVGCGKVDVFLFWTSRIKLSQVRKAWLGGWVKLPLLSSKNLHWPQKPRSSGGAPQWRFQVRSRFKTNVLQQLSFLPLIYSIEIFHNVCAGANVWRMGWEGSGACQPSW